MLRAIFLLFTITAIGVHAQITPPPSGGSGVQSLTTTGSSGASTLTGTVLNVPTYSVGGYTGCTTDSANGIVCTGQVQAGNYLGPIQKQNFYELLNTFTAIASMQTGSGIGSPTQLRIRTEGDSTTAEHNPAVTCELRRRYGAAGFTGIFGVTVVSSIFGDCGSGLVSGVTSGTAVVNNGTSVPYDYTLSPEGAYWNISPGGCVTVTSGGGYVPATLLALEYIQEPAAGTLQMLSNNAGAGWVSQGTVSAAGTLSGQVFQTTLAEAPYQIRACATVANVKLYNAALINTAKNGVVIEAYGRAGLSIADYTATPTSITAAWDAFENPQLVMFKMDANGSSGPAACTFTPTTGGSAQNFAYYWNLWSTRWLTGGPPTRDIVVDGSFAAQGNSCIPSQNAVQQAWAKTNRKAYFDDYNIAGSTTNQQNLGWMAGDTAHQTPVGQIATGEILLRELGLNTPYTGAVNNDVANVNSYSKNRYLVQSGGYPTGINSTLETVVPINGGQDVGYSYYRGVQFTATPTSGFGFAFTNTASATDPNFRFQAQGVDQLMVRANGDLYSQTANNWSLRGPVSTTYMQFSTNGDVNLFGTGQLYLPNSNFHTSKQVVDDIATGTAPLVITSTTPVANLVVQKHPQMTTCATTTTCANTAQLSPRIVHGNVALTAGSAVVASITAFTATTSFDCTGTDVTSAAAVKIANTSTTSITITGTSTDVISYVCVGN